MTASRFLNRKRQEPAAMSRNAAFVYAFATVFIVAFQLALAAGAPWGEFAMGGAFPGQFPAALRLAAVAQAALLVFWAVVVWVRAGLILPRWTRSARWLIWGVVIFAAFSLVLNLITPSAGERAIWAPVALIMFLSSLLVARSHPQTPADPPHRA